MEPRDHIHEDVREVEGLAGLLVSSFLTLDGFQHHLKVRPIGVTARIVTFPGRVPDALTRRIGLVVALIGRQIIDVAVGHEAVAEGPFSLSAGRVVNPVRAHVVLVRALIDDRVRLTNGIVFLSAGLMQ
jgi:hypothetical protein